MPQRRQALERIVLHATSLRIPIVEVEGGTLNSVAGFDGHQGVALVVRPREWASVDDVLARAAERGEPPFVLVLDSLEDPQNVGTLLRSAEAVGVHGVIFPTHHQAPLSPAAIKASAGATEHLLLVPVDDLPGALADLRVRGVRAVGADEDAPLTGRQADLRGPLALVVGSEGHGIGPAVRRRIDLSIRIPMRGSIGSLNAAVAGSVLLFEILDQRGEAPTEPRLKIAERLPVPPSEVTTGAPDARTTSATAEPEAEPTATPARKRSRVASVVAGEPAATPESPVADEPAATPESSQPTAPKRRSPKKSRASAAGAPVIADDSPPEAAPKRRGAKAPPAATAADPVIAEAAPAAAPRQKRVRTPRQASVDVAADDLLPGGPPPVPDESGHA